MPMRDQASVTLLKVCKNLTTTYSSGAQRMLSHMTKKCEQLACPYSLAKDFMKHCRTLTLQTNPDNFNYIPFHDIFYILLLLFSASCIR